MSMAACEASGLQPVQVRQYGHHRDAADVAGEERRLSSGRRGNRLARQLSDWQEKAQRKQTNSHFSFPIGEILQTSVADEAEQFSY